MFTGKKAVIHSIFGKVAGSVTVKERLLTTEEVKRRERTYWPLRRLQDIVLSCLALLVLWPLMLVVAIAIVIDSPGASPIFTQTRVGKGGKPFKFSEDKR